MFPSMKRLLFATGVAATVAIVGVGTAAAAGPTYTLHVGTATGTTTFTGTNSSVQFHDQQTGQNLTCASGTAKGPAQLGVSHANPITTITSSTWVNCTGVLGVTLNVAQSGVWKLEGSAATTSGGVTTGYVDNVTANVTSSLCSFTVTGAADGVYTNSTHTLAMANVAGSGHVLTISGVSGCAGALVNGNTAAFTSNYVVSTPLDTATNHLTVVSP